MGAGAKWVDRVTKLLSRSLSEFNPFRGEEPYVAVDLGSSTIKILEVQGRATELRVTGFGRGLTPTTGIQNNMVVETGAVAEVVRALYQEAGLRAKKAVTVVPGPAVIIKRVNLPAQSELELENTILAEAGNFIPEELENVNLDYQITDYLDDGRRIEVLVVAAKKELVASYSETLREAGLLPVVVDVDYFALENMFELNYEPPPGRAIAIVNIGGRYSAINIIKNGHSTFTGDVPVGGRDITDSLVRDLNLSFEEAEALKAGKSLDAATMDHVGPILEAAAGAVIDEIHHALSFFWTAATDETIDQIYLSGGSARMPGLAEQLAERVGAPVDLANPFAHLSLADELDQQTLREQAPEFAVAAGLATRRPNDK